MIRVIFLMVSRLLIATPFDVLLFTALKISPLRQLTKLTVSANGVAAPSSWDLMNHLRHIPRLAALTVMGKTDRWDNLISDESAASMARAMAGANPRKIKLVIGDNSQVIVINK